MKVAVLKGGRSSEHDVSLASAHSVAEGLRLCGHEVTEVLLTKEGEWLADNKTVLLEPGGGLLGVDVVFPVLHGPYCEDGTVQGLLDLLDVPYVGSGVAASAVCMDKVLTKDVLAKFGIPQVRYERVSERRWETERSDVEAAVAKLGWPVFVKPARLGSSVGISKVFGPDELAAAIDLALDHDDVALVEEMATGLEVECAVLGTLEPEASLPGEIALHADWYDYEAKYTPGGMELIIPARISETAAEKVRTTAVEAFHRLGCAGLARVDFFVDGELVILNEINTMPGFTDLSAYPKMWDASGVAFGDLLERLLADAQRRYEHERDQAY